MLNFAKAGLAALAEFCGLRGLLFYPVSQKQSLLLSITLANVDRFLKLILSLSDSAVNAL